MKNSGRKTVGLKMFLICFVVCVLCFGTYATVYAKPIKWKFLTSWPGQLTGNKYQFYPWVKAINEKLKGRLEVSWVGPEAVPGTKQLKPVRDGVFDGVFTHPAYHAGDIGLGMGMDLFMASPTERQKAGLFEILDEVYRTKQNIHYLAYMGDGVGYHVGLRDQCIATAHLKGLKIRTNPMYAPLIRKMGGATVSIPASEIYTSLEKGVVDGVCSTALDILAYKMNEVTKYTLRPTFGDVGFTLLVNLDSWKKLPPDLQAEVTKITMEAAEEGRRMMAAEYERTEKEAIRLGMEICTLPPQEADKFLQYYYDETWQFVMKLSPEFGPRLKAAADELVKK